MIEVRVPEAGESITEGTISAWMKKQGDVVQAGEVLVELETDKVNMEVNAEYSGVLKEIKKGEGENVQVGEVIAIIDETATASAEAGSPAESPAKEEEKAEEQPAKEPVKSVATDGSDDHEAIASPAVRRLAREKGIPLDQIAAKDPMGRITAEDVARASQGEATPKQPQVTPSKSAPVASDSTDEDPLRPVERVRMSRRRQTIAKRLVEAQHTAAMLTTFNEVDMTAVMQLRNRRKDAFLKEPRGEARFYVFLYKSSCSCA